MISEKFKIKLVGNESVSKKEEAEIFSIIFDFLLKRNQVKQKLARIKEIYNEKI